MIGIHSHMFHDYVLDNAVSDIIVDVYRGADKSSGNDLSKNIGRAFDALIHKFEHASVMFKNAEPYDDDYNYVKDNYETCFKDLKAAFDDSVSFSHNFLNSEDGISEKRRLNIDLDDVLRTKYDASGIADDIDMNYDDFIKYIIDKDSDAMEDWERDQEKEAVKFACEHRKDGKPVILKLLKSEWPEVRSAMEDGLSSSSSGRIEENRSIIDYALPFYEKIFQLRYYNTGELSKDAISQDLNASHRTSPVFTWEYHGDSKSIKDFLKETGYFVYHNERKQEELYRIRNGDYAITNDYSFYEEMAKLEKSLKDYDGLPVFLDSEGNVITQGDVKKQMEENKKKPRKLPDDSDLEVDGEGKRYIPIDLEGDVHDKLYPDLNPELFE